MRKYLITLSTGAALILAGLAVKIMVAPNRIAKAEVTTGSTMSIYDLDVSRPRMKELPVQEAPLP